MGTGVSMITGGWYFRKKEVIHILTRLLTKNKTKIPLFWVNFNYQHYKKFGKENSCDLVIHPLLKDDKILKSNLEALVDYIRERYDMDKLV